MKLAVLGAGPAGSAVAALAASRGHEAALWSPRGGGTRHVLGQLRTTGLLDGAWPVRVAADLGRAVEHAELVVICLPGHVLPAVLHRLAAVLTGDPALILAPPGALAPLLLHRLATTRGIATRIGAMPVPPVAAGRAADGAVHVTALRDALWLAALEPGQAAGLAKTAAAAFGPVPELLPGVLAAALAEPGPLAGAAGLLAPGGVKRATLHLLASFAAERDGLAAALGHTLPSLALLLGEGQPPVPQLEEAAAGLAFLEAMGRAARAEVPLIAAALRLLEVAAARRFSPHPVLAELDPQVIQAFA